MKPNQLPKGINTQLSLERTTIDEHISTYTLTTNDGFIISKLTFSSKDFLYGILDSKTMRYHPIFNTKNNDRFRGIYASWVKHCKQNERLIKSYKN